MPLGTKNKYPRWALPKDHEQMLKVAIVLLTDSFYDDVRKFRKAKAGEIGRMISYLPPRYRLQYDEVFAKKFHVCLTVAGWKMFADGAQYLSCLAEELAVSAILRCAETLMEVQGKEPNYHDFKGCILEDADFEWLFDDSADGIDQTNLGEAMGMASLSFSDWFKPFNKHRHVHTLAEKLVKGDGTEPKKPS